MSTEVERFLADYNDAQPFHAYSAGVSERWTIPISIPAGSRLSARLASTAGGATKDLILYGIT